MNPLDLSDEELQAVVTNHHLNRTDEWCHDCAQLFPCLTWQLATELIRTRKKMRNESLQTEISPAVHTPDANELLAINTEWRRLRDAAESALFATNLREEPSTETQRWLDFMNAQRYVERNCCCTTNHARVVTDYNTTGDNS